MRPKSMVLILIALGCGLIASIGISQVMENQKRNGPDNLELQAIYVAVDDIPLGEPLTQQLIQLEEWPKDRVPFGSITELEQIEGRMPRQPLYKGEPILQAKLIDPKRDQGLVSNNIRPGYVAFSIAVDMESGASGLILPGDRVDVLAFLPQGAGVPQTTARTILRNVTVFAVNDQIQRMTDQGATSVTAKTVTLQVTQRDVEKLMLAKHLGRLQLSLRRGDDNSKGDTPGATLADLDPADEDSSPKFEPTNLLASSSPSESDGGLMGFLDKIKQSATRGSDSKNNQLLAGDPTAQMAIITPDGIATYTWDDRQSLPRELAMDASAQAAASGSPPGVSVLTGPPPGVPLPEGLLQPEEEPEQPATDGEAELDPIPADTPQT